jgi:hypothetical protein
MQDQQTATPTNEQRQEPEFDRRRGPRRASEPGEVQGERRQSDRRKRKPGFAGLFGAIFGTDKDDDTES